MQSLNGKNHGWRNHQGGKKKKRLEGKNGVKRPETVTQRGDEGVRQGRGKLSYYQDKK